MQMMVTLVKGVRNIVLKLHMGHRLWHISQARSATPLAPPSVSLMPCASIIMRVSRSSMSELRLKAFGHKPQEDSVRLSVQMGHELWHIRQAPLHNTP